MIYDAAIIGYGPTGAVLASLLAKGGLKILLIDRDANIWDKPRAIGMDHEFLRTMQYLGLAEKILEKARPYPGTKYLDVDGQVMKVLGHQPPPYPLGWVTGASFVQPDLERTLRDHVATLSNIEVRLSTELLALIEDTRGVHLTMQDVETGALSTATVQYAFGCDGANSFVRKALEVDVDDLQFDEQWLVLDAWIEDPTIAPQEGRQYCWPTRPVTYVLGPGNLRRWEMKLLPGESAEDFEADERIKAALEPYVDPSALRIWRSAVYRFHALVAKQWRHSRVFLLGDAAHQTPPFMGQGMCSGVRDAANLAWKINLVNSDGCNETLLDSYQTELLPHVTELIGVTKQLGLIIGELDMVAARHRDRELHRQASDASVPKTRSGFVPPLRTGLIDLDAAGTPTPLAGTLFVQPRVLAPDTSESYLLEDLLQRRFLIVTRGSMPQSWLRKRDLDLWSKLRGERVAIGAPEDRSRPTCDHLVLIELDSVFQSWIESVGAAAVIVRPDRYVYGAARSSTDLHRLLDHLANELIGPRP